MQKKLLVMYHRVSILCICVVIAWASAGRSSTRSPGPRNYPTIGSHRAFTLPNATRDYNSVSSPKTLQFACRGGKHYKISILSYFFISIRYPLIIFEKNIGKSKQFALPTRKVMFLLVLWCW